MNMQEYIDEAEGALLHTYNRYPVVLDRGEGVYLYDTDGIKYLDFVSGIGVFALGYNNKEYNNALKSQVDKLLHTSNYYYNVPAINAAKKLKAVSGMDRVFFTNSGAEAVEGALKAARKYAFLKDGKADHEIIAMNHSFHGRTFGALSVTGNSKYREPFEPMIGNVRFADLNDMESVKKQITDKTCAILLEPVQGEGGIHPAAESFLKEVKAICEEKDILLIFDEIQCGMGRTGYMYAWQQYGVKPDIMTTAKALGCGVPVGAFLMTEKAAQNSLAAGDHGTTYGGNPLACAAACVVVDKLKNGLLAEAEKKGEYLMGKLSRLRKFNFVRDVRGKGLLLGVCLTDKVSNTEIVGKMAANGVLLITAGHNTLRFAPAYTIRYEEIDKACDTLMNLFANTNV